MAEINISVPDELIAHIKKDPHQNSIGDDFIDFLIQRYVNKSHGQDRASPLLVRFINHMLSRAKMIDIIYEDLKRKNEGSNEEFPSKKRLDSKSKTEFYK